MLRFCDYLCFNCPDSLPDPVNCPVNVQQLPALYDPIDAYLPFQRCQLHGDNVQRLVYHVNSFRCSTGLFLSLATGSRAACKPAKLSKIIVH